MSATLPVCVQYAQAFGGPFIAAMAALATVSIAIAQYAVARDRYDLDIFSQRWGALEKIRACYETAEKDAFPDALTKYELSREVYRVVFDDRMAAIADHLIDAAKRLNGIHRVIFETNAEEPAGVMSVPQYKELMATRGRERQNLKYALAHVEGYAAQMFIKIGPRGRYSWPPVWFVMSLWGMVAAPSLVLMLHHCLK